eukprot:m51a1_g1365 hypothetical protein (297) ;mRNA; f:403079-404338
MLLLHESRFTSLDSFTISVSSPRFNNTVAASAGDVRLFAPANLEWSLQGFKVRLAAGSAAVQLEYVTGVQEPFELELESFSAIDTSQATFSALIVQATFMGRCHSTTPAALCPFSGTIPERFNASFAVTTASFCGEITDTVQVRASALRLYRDNQFTEDAAAFIINSPVWAEATFSSSSATITSVEVLSVVARGDAVVRDSGEVDLMGNGWVHVLPQDEPARVRFMFTTSDEFFRVEQDSSSSVVITAQFRVHYLGNNKRSAEHRASTVQITSAQMQVFQSSATPTSAASSLCPWF